MPDQTLVIELGLFLATQTGAFIFYAGTVNQKLKDHERRHDSTEAIASKLAADVAFLKGKESAQS